MTKLSLPLAYRCSKALTSARDPYSSMIQHLQIKILNPVHLCFHPQKVETSKIETGEKIGFEIIPTEIILKIFQFLSISAIPWKKARIKINFQTNLNLKKIQVSQGYQIYFLAFSI